MIKSPMSVPWVDLDEKNRVKILVASLSRVKTLSRETGRTNDLVDTIDEESMPSSAKLYEFAPDMLHNMKFAVVARENQLTPGKIHFVETVALNRWFKVQTFTSRSEALFGLKS